MSSANVFENLQSPVSYDAEIDKGWRLISEKGDNPVARILQVLQDIYWKAVTDEIANALLAFDDYKTFCPEGLSRIRQDAFESDYLQELVDLWDPLGLSDDKKKELCEKVVRNVQGRQDAPHDELVARSLLQACGLTDYDFVQEYRKPTFPSLGPAAQGEERIIALFLAFAEAWRTNRSPTQPEAYNRELLLGYASAITQVMQFFFHEEIKMHLFLFAQKLGKTQKLAYSRMSNNCQVFCNGLVTYKEVFLYPTFDVMYPFLPVSLSLEIEKEPDDHCVSYLQSFVKPLQYPIPGFRSRRAMLGSAITLYSGCAQNDADLIDHVWSVRFGEDPDESFSLGFHLGGPKIGDPYLLKDEEMSCSDRFAAGMLPGSGQSKGCTLADNLLDCPVDNLSVLQTHLLRRQKYYYNSEGEFLSDLGAKAWVTNRLEILDRLRVLNDFLAEIALQFQNSCKEFLSPGCNVKAVRKVWKPADTLFSRAWHGDRRVGSRLRPAPDIDFGRGEMDNWKAVGFFTLGVPLFETHRQMIDGPELFATRLKTLGSLLSARISGKDELWTPWKWCTCADCKVYRLRYICSRVDWNFIAAVDSDGTKPVIRPGHPDYVSPSEVLDALKDGEFWKNVVDQHRHLLEAEGKRHEEMGSTWETTLLLCSRYILGEGTLQDIRDRLEYYKLVFEGKVSVDS
ncbi:uncharacterized protein CDV56_104496 [Aspergillus thermomutatus]|uniref:Uncharacterized protein n=1 Tax=Aspergillus thermomutatus TaxID=41047 RepID=A0A397G7E5_ASPTH|nr:uncharacterized protein CDV56_104496 [Aspergillus thermomutatus]RHZ46517.1 hypothetical protein CDV56_104496 [Aspergillus thermomutatus]